MVQQFGDAPARLRADVDCILCINADYVLDLRNDFLRLGRRQIDLVEYRQHFEALIDRRDAVGNTLRLDTLGRIHDEECSFAGRQRAGNLVREIHVAGRIDEIQLVGLAIAGMVFKRYALRLDRDAALALEVHRVQDLLRHLTVSQAAAYLDKPIGERRLAMINMSDDREVAYLLH